MDQLRSLMQSALARRLGEHLRAEVSPLTNLPNVQGQSLPQRAVSGLRLGTMLPRDLLDTLGLAREAVDYGAKALTGGIAQEVGGLQQIDNPVLRNVANATSFLLPGGPATAITALLGEAGRLGLPSPFGPSDFTNAMQAGADNRGNVISNARAANEGLARESPLATGLLNQLVNPLTYATGGGTEEARAAQQAGRIASGLGLDLHTVNSILYPEGQLIGKAASSILGPAARGVLDRTGLNEALRRRYDLPTAPEAGDLAKYLEAQGLPAPAKMPFESSPLAPEKKPNIFQMARQAGEAAKGRAEPAAQVDTLGLMRDLLKSGDNGKGMVYAPADPAFWQKRVGVDPAAVPDLLRQLQAEGSLAPDQSGELLNTYLTGGARTPVAPDMPGGSLDLPAMPAYPGQTRAEAIGNLTPGEVGQLAQLAYRNEKALKYAMASHPDPVALANAALDRITTNRTLLENLATNYPDLAGKVAYLPEPDTGGGDTFGLMARLKGTPQTPEERAAWQARYAGQSRAGTDILAQGDTVAGSNTTQADLNAMSPEERMAALRKLAGTDQNLAPAARGAGGNSVLDWLLKSPVQGAPQVSRLGIAGSGGVIGAAAGGLAPADSEEQRRIHALQGAAVGTGLGLGAVSPAGVNILKSLPVAKEFTGNLLGAANVAQREAMDRSNKGITSFTNLANSWRVQQTSTIRNLLQDELTARLWNSNAGIRQQMMNDNWSSLVQLYNLGQRNGYDALPTQTTGLLDKWGLTGYMPNIGAGFNNVNESLIKNLSAADMAKMEAIFAGLNPAQGGVPLAGVALGAVKGYTRAWQEKIFSTLNEFTRLAARHAAFQDEFAPAMQVAAHDFVARHGATGALDPAAGFSAADVGQALGQAAQDEWAAQVQKVTHLAEQRALDIHGDFTRTNVPGASKSVGDRAANLFNTAVPFSSWALKAYPRTAAMMLDHPGVSLAIMLLTMGQAEKVQREGKAGLVGGVPIDANTPLVGGIAKKMLGNFPGQAYVNLLGSLTPVSTSALLSPDQPVNANLYQRAGEALDRAGFSFNPLIQAAAYASNKDYQRPSPMSRTAGLEMALPGPDMPSLALGPLNAARVAAGGSAQHTTPEDRKLAEIFYLSTGHQIADPTNVSDPQRAALLASTLDPNSPIRKLAAQSTGQANVARNLVSLVSPASLQAAPRVEQQAEAASYAARHAPPANYDPRTINALMNSGNMAQYIEAVMRQRANVGTQGEVSPLLQLTSQSAGQDRASMYLQALGASSIFGSPLVGAPQSLINQILGLSTPSVEIGGPQGGQR